MLRKTLYTIPLLIGTAAYGSPQSDVDRITGLIKSRGAVEHFSECGTTGSRYSLEFDGFEVNGDSYDAGQLTLVESDGSSALGIGLIDFTGEGLSTRVRFRMLLDVMNPSEKVGADGTLDGVVSKEAGLFGIIGWSLDMLTGSNPCDAAVGSTQFEKALREPTPHESAMYQALIASLN
jgi:hypothetical protein